MYLELVKKYLKSLRLISQSTSGEWVLIFGTQIAIMSCLFTKHWISFLVLLLLLARLMCYRSLLLVVKVGLAVGICVVMMMINREELTDFSTKIEQSQQSGQESSLIVTIDPIDLKTDGDYWTAIGSLVDITDFVEGRQSSASKRQNFSGSRVKLSDNHAWTGPKNQVVRLKVTGNWQDFETKTNFAGFDAKSYYYSKKMTHVFKISDVSHIEVVQQSEDWTVSLQNMRLSFFSHLEKIPFDRSLQLMMSLLFGQQQTIDSSLKQTITGLGLLAFFALSGEHLTILSHFLRKLAYRLNISRETTASLIFLILLCYCYLANWPVSIVRAFLAYSLKASRLMTDSIDGLGCSGVVIICVNPYVVLDVSFQLSFALATTTFILAKVLAGNRLRTIVTRNLLVMLVATMILSYYFFEVNLLANLWSYLMASFFAFILVPYFLLLMGYGLRPIILESESLIGLMFKGYDLVLTVVGTIMELILNQLFLLLEVLNEWRFAKIVVGRLPAVVQMIAIIALLVFLKIVIKSTQLNEKGIQKRTIGPHTIKGIHNLVVTRITKYRIVLVIMLMIIGACLSYNWWNAKASVVMIDVSQGDSLLMFDRRKRWVTLIDTGGKYNFFDKTVDEQFPYYSVVPAIKSEGIQRIDQLILTHWDLDHVGNAKTILKEFRVKELLYVPTTKSGDEKSNQLAREILETANRYHTRVKSVQIGNSYEGNALHYSIIGPLREYDSKNESSIIVYAKFAQMSWLMMGDAEEKAEKSIMTTYPNLPVDVLKVGHHGSKSSTQEAFANWASPKISLISVEKNNRYGHPNKEVLERLLRISELVLKTSEDGAVRVDTYPNQQSVLEVVKEKSNAND